MSEIISASSNSSTTNSHTFLKAIKFTLISYVISVVLIALLAVIIVYTDISQKISVPSVRGITLFGAFLSAVLTARTCKSKGWVCGFFTGLFNVALLMFIGTALISSSFFTKSNVFLAFCGGLSGMAGGILGVNLGNN